MIAVVVLLLTLIVVDENRTAKLGEYESLIRGPLFSLALIIILVWALSLDIFDTMLNSFQVELAEANHIRKYFYRQVGPLRQENRLRFGGGVSYGYLGHALMPIFVLMVFSWFQAGLVGFATALYVFFAYPYYYGFWAVKAPGEWAPIGPVDASGSTVVTEFLPARWIINRDGDPVVRTRLGDVQRITYQSFSGSWWPPVVLGLLFLVPSIYLMTI
jgi:hypothetical protein